jgi:tRNA A37 threonylcarbamoyladenosine dehydratase
MEQFKRLISLIGLDNYNKLANSKIAIFGLGGIGSNVLSSLVRSGIDSFVLVDYDLVETSNFNRQKQANYSTLGLKKTIASYHLAKKVNNNISCKLYDLKIDHKTIDKVDLKDVCYIVDAVDDLDAKIAILKKAKELNIPLISSMGVANKVNIKDLKIADVSKTDTCPLARKYRKMVRDLGIKDVPVLYSKEEPLNKDMGTIDYLVTAAALLITEYVIKDLLEDNNEAA